MKISLCKKIQTCRSLTYKMEIVGGGDPNSSASDESRAREKGKSLMEVTEVASL